MLRTRRAAAIGLVLLGPGCATHPEYGVVLGTAVPGSEFREQVRTLQFAPGVTTTLVAPARLDPGRAVDLVLYALPNGNSTAQTMGRRMTPGLDWHFDIQHIAAQTRALRTMGMPQAVVAYLEADSKSWPAWRQRLGYEQANRRIVEVVDELRGVLRAAGAARVNVTLTGHSGGGSFLFGFIDGHGAIPDWVDRVAFLDANYNFAPPHGDKLAAWLGRDTVHTLVVLAYDDREIMLDGKKVVSDSGGTWRATERMMRYFRTTLSFSSDSAGGFDRHRSAQVEVLAHRNPENRILHTEMIGEMNGYMHALLLRRPEYTRRESVLGPARIYMKWVEPE